MQKTALITGGNKGIGFEICRQLGEKGFLIFLAARNESRGEEAVLKLEEQGIKARFVHLDAANRDSIIEAFEFVKGQTKTLDVLINNAGVLLDQGENILDVADQKMVETQNINAFGPLRIVQIFEPLMQSGSRIINISSSGGAISEGASFWAPSYCVSKTALNAITLQLAHFLQTKGVAVNAVSPGWVRTDMGGADADWSVAQGADTPVWLATEAAHTLTGKFWKGREEIAW